MLEDQQQEQRHRASGQAWPRRDQTASQVTDRNRPVPQRQGSNDFQDFQQTVGRIAESMLKFTYDIMGPRISLNLCTSSS